MHAVLVRKRKDNVKGRDWYDFEWYVTKRMAMNLKHFPERARDSGDMTNRKMTAQHFRKLSTARINSVDIQRVKADVLRFIPDSSKLDIGRRNFSTTDRHSEAQVSW